MLSVYDHLAISLKFDVVVIFIFCLFLCLFVSLFMCACEYVCVRACVCVCVCVFVCACVYVCVRVWSDQVTMVTMNCTWLLNNNIKQCKKTYRQYFSENPKYCQTLT